MTYNCELKNITSYNILLLVRFFGLFVCVRIANIVIDFIFITSVFVRLVEAPLVTLEELDELDEFCELDELDRLGPEILFNTHCFVIGT